MRLRTSHRAWWLLLAALIFPACAEGEEAPGFELVNSAGGTHGQPTGGSGGSGKGGSTSVGGTGASGGDGGSSGTGGSAGEAGTSGGGGTHTGGSSGASGKGGSAGSAGAAGSGGNGGTCVQTDPEPNSTEATAHSIGNITDCDDTGAELNGALDGKSDPDWYTFHGSDSFGCVVGPTFTLMTNDTIKLCAYFLCDSGSTTVTCQGGSQPSTSPSGKSGCCGDVLTLAPDVECSGSDDSSTVWFELAAPQDACLVYKLDYHY